MLDCLFEKARVYCRVGDMDAAYTAYDFILNREKTTTGKKIDASMEKARVALFHMVRYLYYIYILHQYITSIYYINILNLYTSTTNTTTTTSKCFYDVSSSCLIQYVILPLLHLYNTIYGKFIHAV